MAGSEPAVQAAAQALDGLKAAATALRQACAAAPSPPLASAPQDPAAGRDWESRLAAVNAAVGWALSPRQGQPPVGSGGGSGASLALHQSELIDAVADCPTNCVTFLPLGACLGANILQQAGGSVRGCWVLIPVPTAAARCALPGSRAQCCGMHMAAAQCCCFLQAWACAQ